MSSQVIFLNGPTGVGKTTLAKALQERLPSPYLHLSIDMMIDMMPEKLNDWEGGQKSDGFWWKTSTDSSGHKLAHLQIGAYAKKVCHSLMDIAITLLNNGHNLIIDEICLRPESYADWHKKLKPFKTLYVGLDAPLSMLEKREFARTDRMKGSARTQHKLVHAGNEYDVSLNTHELSTNDLVDKILTLLLAGPTAAGQG